MLMISCIALRTSMYLKVLNGPAPIKLFRLIRLTPRAHHIIQFQIGICEYLFQVELVSRARGINDFTYSPPNINVPQRAGVVHWQQNSPSPPLPHLSAFTQPWPPSQPLTLSHHDESGASGSSSRPNINLPQQASVVQQNSPSPYAPQGSQRPQRRAGAVQVVPPNTDFGLGHTQHQSTSHNPNL